MKNLYIGLLEEFQIIRENNLILEKEIENIIFKLNNMEDLWDAWRAGLRIFEW